MKSPDVRIIAFHGVRPIIADDVFLAPGCMVLGDVILAEESSVWYQAVIRGDVNLIRIGRRTNIQDLAMIHVTTDTHPTRIGDNVTVGHSAIIHGATLEDGCLVGMGAIILDGARVGEQAMVAAGSLVPADLEVPPRTLVLGSPARVKRSLRPEEVEQLEHSSRHYRELALQHARELGLSRSS